MAEGAAAGEPSAPLAAWVLAGLVVAGPLLAALVGAPGPLAWRLNLGPGDGPYVRGFAPAYEIDEKVATHWTTYHAAVEMPVEIRGAAEVTYRMSRVFPETAQVEVGVNGVVLQRFSCRGGAWEERSLALAAAPPGMLRIGFDVDSHERRDRGLKLDWVRVAAAPGARVRLVGTARWVPALLISLVLLLHVLAGWSLLRAALLSVPWALGAATALLLGPWLVHRLLRGLPLAVALVGLAGVALGRWLVARGQASPRTLRAVFALVVATFLVRSLLVNHPDFYYPDLRTHARLVDVLGNAGLEFFVSPSKQIWDHGVWRTEAYGKTYAFPYSPAFHLPFALLGLPYDTLITALKLGAAAVSTIPLVLVWAMARRLGIAPLGAFLMAVIPTYTSRLSFAFLPSLFGHAVDMAFLLWLLGSVERVATPRVWLVGAAWVAGSQLAYVSGVVNTGVFVATLALVTVGIGGQGAVRRGVSILAMGLVGAGVSLALYYRDFLPMVWDVIGRVGGGGPGGVSRYPVQSWLSVVWGRTRDFFDHVYPVLAALGFGLIWRRARGRTVIGAWLAAYFLLLLGRAKLPDIFLHGHETLFLTPLVCLASGEALARLARRRLAWRVAAIAAGILLACQGLWLQWRSVAAQLANAL